MDRLGRSPAAVQPSRKSGNGTLGGGRGEVVVAARNLKQYSLEGFRQVFRPSGKQTKLLRSPSPSQQGQRADLVLRVRGLGWTAAELAENVGPMRAARIRAWDTACNRALENAPPARSRRFRLVGPSHRLSGGNSR